MVRIVLTSNRKMESNFNTKGFEVQKFCEKESHIVSILVVELWGMQCMLIVDPLLMNILWGRINNPFLFFFFSFNSCGAIPSTEKCLKEKKQSLSSLQIFKLRSSTE